MNGDLTTERWRELKAVFATARELDAAEREAFLAGACTDDTLREEVRSLLAADDTPGLVDQMMDDVMRPLLQRITASSLEGTRTGPYEVLHELGRGGMGRVYKARDTRLDRFVALKFLPSHLSEDEDAKARFMQEARAASSLDHPNICTIHDVGETEPAPGNPGGQLYITMACYEGETLAGKVEQGPLEIDQIIDIACQVTEGLARAHEAGIVHRDIKPSNLMMTERGVVKILDFGIAKLGTRPGAITRTGAQVGTIAYMAPEQVRGEAVDPRADLWALGVVLYELLAGQRPFQGATESALLYAILEDDPRPLTTLRSDVPGALERVVQRLLAKPREDRYQQAAALIEDLHAVRGEGMTSSLHRAPLPVALTSFVGREREVGQIEALLDTARLVTLTGPAGTGKTRLSLQVASRLRDAFEDDVGFVSLAPVTDPALVAPTMAQALDVTTSGVSSPLDQVKRLLQDRETLLVLDNFEQVVAAAPVVSELLSVCPRLKVLVTSRVPLRISGEHEFPVQPLEWSGVDGVDGETGRSAPAVQLFVERAKAVRPDFALTGGNAPAVAELCRRLDGLPLAIELAAARVKLFSPRAMLARIEGRFDFLKGGACDVPDRHQTLRQAIAWSYNLLNVPHQQLFRRMAVCVDGCSLEAIRALVASLDTRGIGIVEGLAALVDHSLVRQDEGPNGEPRFTMLETLRAYGVERLNEAGELEVVRRLHAEHYLDLAERAAHELTGAAQADWFDRLEQEHDNLRAALRWAETRQVHDIGLRLGAALWRFWIVRGHLLEGRQWLEKLLDTPEHADLLPSRAHVLNGLGTIAHNQGDNVEARAFLEESLSLWRTLGDERGTALVLNNLAWVACEVSDLDEARTLAQEAETLCRKLDDRRGIAVALNNLGWVANYQGEYQAARAFHQESLVHRRALGDQRGIAFALTNLAWADACHGSYERAVGRLDKALAIAQTVRDGLLHTWIFVVRAQVVRDRRDEEQAIVWLKKSLSLWKEGGNKSIRAWALGILGGIRLDQGRIDEAEVLLQESMDWWTDVGCAWGEAAVACELGRIAVAQSDYRQALDRYRASWVLRHSMGDRRGMAECLEAMGALAVDREAWKAAVQLFAAAQSMRTAIEVPLPLYRRDLFDRHLKLLQNELGSEAFDRAWAEGKTGEPGQIVERVFK